MGDLVIVPSDVLRFPVRGWAVAEDLAHEASRWVSLQHMDHPTGQEARIMNTPEGPRLRFRKRGLRVTVTVMVPTQAIREDEPTIFASWDTVGRIVDEAKGLTDSHDLLRRFGSVTSAAVEIECTGCGNYLRADRARIDSCVSAAAAMGVSRTNLVPGHRMKRTREAVVKRARRQAGPETR